MKQCSLCGGKLDNNKRCTLCGLDNTKNDDQYKHLLNQNDCEHKPLTHVHEEPVKKTYTESYSNAKSTYSSAKYNSSTFKKAAKKVGAKKTESKGKAATIVSVITIILALIGPITELIDDFRFEAYEEPYKEEYYDPYEYVVDEMPEVGSFFQATLEAGIYKVGVDIPKGIYEAEILSGDYGYVEINDSWNSIFYSENIGYEEQNIVYDLRLYDGTYFTVSSNITISLSTKNAQPLTGVGEPNPLTESFVLTDKAEAGVDFEAGIYDIVYQPSEEYEYGSVEYMITDEAGYDYSWSIYFDSGIGAETYHNVVLPEGANIILNDELKSVTLVPSATVFTTEYQEFYETYY